MFEGLFLLNNLFYGVFMIVEDEDEVCCGVVIGDMIFDMMVVEVEGFLFFDDDEMFAWGTWDLLIDVGFVDWVILCGWLEIVLVEGSVFVDVLVFMLVLMWDVMLYMLFMVMEYIDFYVGKYYVMNVGMMFCGVENVLLLNWLLILIGYNGWVLFVVVLGIFVCCSWG